MSIEAMATTVLCPELCSSLSWPPVSTSLLFHPLKIVFVCVKFTQHKISHFKVNNFLALGLSKCCASINLHLAPKHFVSPTGY